MRRVCLLLVFLGCLIGCGRPALDLQLSSVSVDRTTGVVADGKDTAIATIRLVGKDGKPVAGVAVELRISGSGGTVAPAQLTTDSHGQGQAKVTSTVAEEKTLSALARIDDKPSALSSTTITFVPGAPDPNHSSLTAPARGHIGEDLPLTVLVSDSQGNPCPGQSVTLAVSASDGVLTPSSGQTGPDGRFSASFRSGLVQMDTVTASTGGFDLSAQVIVAPPAWTNIGPEGGNVSQFAFDPVDASVVYAETWTGGLFKTKDAGGSWAPIDAGLTSFALNALVIDPHQRQRLFAASLGGGVFRSTDAGASWSQLDPRVSDAVAVDPSIAGVVYAGSAADDGIFKSTDGGDTWTAGQSNLDGHRVWSIAVDPGDSSVVYALTLDGGVYKSTDGGMHWAVANSGLPGLDLDGMVLAPTSPSTLYVYSRGLNGVWTSTDGGGTWTAVGAGWGGGPFGIAVDPADPRSLYVASNGGLAHSSDGGASWTHQAAAGTALTAVGISPQSSSVLYVGAGTSGVAKSTDQGASWSAANSGLRAHDVRAVRFDGSMVLAGAELGALSSSDQGATWSVYGSGLPAPIYGFAQGVHLYAAAYDDVYQAAWSPFASGLPAGNQAPDAIVAVPNTDVGRDTVLVAMGQQGVYRFDWSWTPPPSGTSTWQPGNGLGGVTVVGLDKKGNWTTFFAATSGGVFRTDDAGANWSHLAGTSSSNAVSASPSSTTLYSCDWTGAVIKSPDLGTTWVTVRQPSGHACLALTQDPSDSQIAYAAIDGEGLLKTTDGGASWVAKNSGLWLRSIQSIVIPARDDASLSHGLIYLATGAGVFVTYTAGE